MAEYGRDNGGQAAATLPTVHILGGGPSGLSAAFHLTSPTTNPGWEGRYKVVVHQLGWRLGGKGATGRSAERAWRVEEHGIHLFGNMYSNALHQIHEAFSELNDGRTMETEFEPSDFQLVTDFYDGRWHGFDGGLPHNDEKPWEVDSSIASMGALLQSLESTVRGILTGQQLPVPGKVETLGAQPSAHKGIFESALDFIHHHAPDPIKAAFDTALSQLESFADQEFDITEPSQLQGIGGILEFLLGILDDAMGTVSDASDRLRWIYVQIDLLKTAITGTLADDVLIDGIDVIDDINYREWLEKHGASDLTMQSSLLQAIPNTCMQYPHGDSTIMPSMAASAYLTFILRQLVAPGDAAYFFKVGTGTTVIKPLYQALVARGVEFEFFHKITDLVPDSSGKKISAIKIDVQATTISGAAYDPLVPIPATGETVWPAEPRFELLEQGDELKSRGINLESWWNGWTGGHETTVLLEPNDHVIVAMPPKAVHYSCQSALAADTDWATMISEVVTTPTQALQIWLDKPLSELGWRDLDKTNRWLGPAYQNPISAFGDFTRTIEHEQWPAGNTPRGLIYFCGPLEDPAEIPDFDDTEFPQRQHEQVRAMAVQYLRTIGGLLPGAANGGVNANSLDFSMLTCYDEASAGNGANRVAQQFYRANIDPNERYTVSAPGTLKYRLKAWGSTFDNVTLSSDAIYTGFNIGSFEGSVMSGKLASHAVTGLPKLDDIWGYDFLHPGTTPAPNPPLGASSVQDLTEQAPQTS